MTQDETDRLLRPRVASHAATIPVVGSSDSRSPATTAAPAPASSTPRRRRFLKCLLVGAALYASLLLCWSASHVGLQNGSDGSSAASTLRSAMRAVVREAKELQLMRMEFLLTTTGSLEEVKPRDQEASLREEQPKEQVEGRPNWKASIQEAEEHARSVKMLPANESKKRRLKCVGWRATGQCTPHGPREPEHDKDCYNVIPNSLSGYCEVQDQDTGELFRVMKRYCASLRYDAIFRCSEAPSLVNYQLESVGAVEKALVPGFALPNVLESTVQPRDGIVMVVYPRLIPSAYATIRALRTVLGCQLPIEIWYREAEIRGSAEALSPLLELANTSDAGGSLSFRKITDHWATGFGAKVFAVYSSFFERVLFLDADNVPARDPTYMFESPEFVDTGAVFWPDFWHPGHTIFNIHGQSLLWEVLGTTFVNSFEQESGQLLIDRKRHAAPLELVKFYTSRRPNPFTRLKLAYGDKDLFRFAWMKLDIPFTMIQTPPAVAGKVVNGSFCGMTMVQHDPRGDVLFLHRNSNKLTGQVKREVIYYRPQAIKNVREKLLKEGIDHVPDKQAVDEEIARLRSTPAPTMEPPELDGLPDPAMWTHLLSFNTTSQRGFYKIQPYRAAPQFPDWQRCYGQRELGKNRHFYTQEFAKLPFAELETHIRKFAQEAEQIRQRKVQPPN